MNLRSTFKSGHYFNSQKWQFNIKEVSQELIKVIRSGNRFLRGIPLYLIIALQFLKAVFSDEVNGKRWLINILSFEHLLSDCTSDCTSGHSELNVK